DCKEILASTLQGCPTAMETDYQFLDPAAPDGSRSPDQNCSTPAKFPGFAQWFQEPDSIASAVNPSLTANNADKDIGDPNTTPAIAPGEVQGPNLALDY